MGGLIKMALLLFVPYVVRLILPAFVAAWLTFVGVVMVLAIVEGNGPRPAQVLVFLVIVLGLAGCVGWAREATRDLRRPDPPQPFL